MILMLNILLIADSSIENNIASDIRISLTNITSDIIFD